MEPISGLSAKSASNRLSFYVAVQLASVLLPGAVVLTELTILGVHLARRGDADIAFILDTLSAVTGASVIVFLLFAVAASYVVGYLARELGFRLVASAERLDSRRVRRGPAPPTAFTRATVAFGDEFAEKLVEIHPILSHGDTGKGEFDVSLPIGGGHRASAPHHLLAYNKLWLRRHAPALNVDHVEAEINILVSTVVPVLALAVDATVLSGTPLVVRILALPVAFGVAFAIVRAVLRLRKTEQWEAFRNVAFDLAMRIAENKYPGQRDIETESDAEAS